MGITIPRQVVKGGDDGVKPFKWLKTLEVAERMR